METFFFQTTTEVHHIIRGVSWAANGYFEMVLEITFNSGTVFRFRVTVCVLTSQVLVTIIDKLIKIPKYQWKAESFIQCGQTRKRYKDPKWSFSSPFLGSSRDVKVQGEDQNQSHTSKHPQWVCGPTHQCPIFGSSVRPLTSSKSLSWRNLSSLSGPGFRLSLLLVKDP